MKPYSYRQLACSFENRSLNSRLDQIKSRKSKFPLSRKNIQNTSSHKTISHTNNYKTLQKELAIEKQNFILLMKLAEVRMKPAFVSKAWRNDSSNFNSQKTLLRKVLKRDDFLLEEGKAERQLLNSDNKKQRFEVKTDKNIESCLNQFQHGRKPSTAGQTKNRSFVWR